MVDGSYSSGKNKLKSSRRERREKESFATALDELISLEKTATAVNYNSHNSNNNVSRGVTTNKQQHVDEQQQQQQPVEQQVAPPPSPTIRPKKHPRIDLATTVGNITNSPYNPSSSTSSSASPPSPVCTKALWLDDINNNKDDNKLSNYQEQIEKLKQVTVTVKELPVSPPQTKINNNLINSYSKQQQQQTEEDETTTTTTTPITTTTTTTKVVYDMSKTPQFVRNMDLLQRMRIQYNKQNNNIISYNSNKRKHCDFEIETGEKPLTPPMLYSKIWKPTIRDEWFDCTSEMAALCAEASLRSTLSQQNKQSKISMASMNNTISNANNINGNSSENNNNTNNINTNDNNDIDIIPPSNKVAEPINLSKEYIHQRIDIDDPLYGYQIRHSKGGWLQGFILYTTFTTWVKYFKWDSLHPKSGIDSRKVSEYGIKDYKWDSEGKLSTELESQLRNGDPDDSGMIWNTIAEISLVSGLGCGEYLLRMAIDDIIQKGYSYIVLHATSSSKAFYERFGFIRVGAVCKYGRSKNICGYRHWTYANENKRNLTAIGGPSYMMALKLPSNNDHTVSVNESSFLDTVQESSCFVNVKPTVLPNHLNVLSKEQQLLQKQHQERRRRQLQKQQQQQKQPNQYTTTRTSTSTSTITTPPSSTTTTTNSMLASANANNNNNNNNMSSSTSTNTHTKEKTAEETKSTLTPTTTPTTTTTIVASTKMMVKTQPQHHHHQQEGQTTKEASKDNTKTTTTGGTPTPIATVTATTTTTKQQQQHHQQQKGENNNNNNTKSTSPTTTTTSSSTTTTGTRHSKRAPKSTTFYTATMASTTSDENSFTNNSMIKRRGMGLFGKKVCKRHPQKWYACTVVRENFMKKTFEVLWDDGTVSFNLPMQNFKPSDPIEQPASSKKSPKATTTAAHQQFHNKENTKNTSSSGTTTAATTTTKKSDSSSNNQKRISSSNNNKPKVSVAKKSNTSSKHKKPITKNNNSKSNKSKPTTPTPSSPNGYYGSIWRNKQFFEVRIQPGAKFVARFISKNIAEQTKSFVVDCLNNKKITFDTSKQIAIDTFKANDNALLGL